MWERLFDGPVHLEAAALAVVPTLVVAWIVARLVKRLAAAGLQVLLQDTLALSSPLVRAPLRLISMAAFVLTVAVFLFPAFQIVGLRPRTGVELARIAEWTFASGLRIALVVLLAYALVRTIALLVARFQHEVTQGTGLDALERAKRARTLGGVIQNATTVVIVTIAALTVLRELQVDIAPILTGAGILGLAIGFGAQTLVRDIISGFFLILEDQVRVGDVAAINGTGGLVEAINLRTIVLRDAEGIVHVFPNGGITTLANRTKDFSFYVIDLGISYDEDPDRVSAVLRETAAALQADPKYGPNILAPLEIQGVDAFADSAVMMKMRIKTVPLKQWEVGREFRRRIKKAFDQHAIEIPFPQRVVTTRPARADPPQ
ncbi:MAG: mechanosensitive ion channel family protein [Acidobacteria bacterium]|nr:mechanosensitive ion channel family protein [Acidobacteriota bacterium]